MFFFFGCDGPCSPLLSVYCRLSCVIDERPHYFHLYSVEIAVQACYDFPGFLAEKKITESSSLSSTGGSTLTLARLDAFTATVVSFLQEHETDNVNDQNYKAYHQRFSCFLPSDFNQLI